MGKIIAKVVNYFTANTYRKVFICGLGAAVLLAVANIFFKDKSIIIGAALAVVIAAGASLIESMIDRVEFKKHITKMQTEHFQNIVDRGADENGVIPSAFSESEMKYLKKEKTKYVLMILVKTVIILMLFILIFS